MYLCTWKEVLSGRPGQVCFDSCLGLDGIYEQRQPPESPSLLIQEAQGQAIVRRKVIGKFHLLFIGAREALI